MQKILDLGDLKSQLAEYILTIMSSFSQKSETTDNPKADAREIAEDIFHIITGRSYSHLSRRKAGQYKELIVRHIDRSVRAGKPAMFFYDLGPGYHASLHPGKSQPSFGVGLAELFALYQVNEFAREVHQVYREGARFFLIIDNLCALSTNDIPVDKTSQYCSELRSLIQDTGTQNTIEVLVESELFEEQDYPRLGKTVSNDETRILSEVEIENVSRFVGRRCDMSEALARIDIYAKASEVTERNLSSVVTGVRLTQRATENTLGFRSFPGGDSRIQAGQIAITHNKKGKLCPILLTSRNIAEYDIYRFELPDEVPDSIQQITYVKTAHH